MDKFTKKCLTIIGAVVFSLACGNPSFYKEEDPDPTYFINVYPKTLHFPAEGGTEKIYITTNYDAVAADFSNEDIECANIDIVESNSEGNFPSPSNTERELTYAIAYIVAVDNTSDKPMKVDFPIKGRRIVEDEHGNNKRLGKKVIVTATQNYDIEVAAKSSEMSVEQYKERIRQKREKKDDNEEGEQENEQQ